MPLPIPQQVLAKSPKYGTLSGKALRQEYAMNQQEMELRDLQIEGLKNPKPDPEETRDQSKFVQESLANAGAAAIIRVRDNPESTAEEITATFSAALTQSLGQEAADEIQSQWDTNGDGVLGPDEWTELTSFTTAYMQGLDVEGGEKTTVLTLDEKLEMGMKQNWAENSVVERDETGNISVTSQPTGMTEADLAARGGVNASGVSQNTIDFQDNVIGAVGAVQMGTEMLVSSATNPEALGVPGGFMRFGSNLVSGAKAIADWAGYEKLSLEDTENQTMGSGAFDYSKLDTDKLGVSGAEAEKFRAAVYGIAFAAAVAEQGTRPTDKDIQQFIDQIGGRATSAQSFRETIAQFMRRQDRRLKTIADVKQISDIDRAAAFKAWTPAFRNFMETYAKTSGRQTATNAETDQRFIEMSPGNWEEF